MRTNSFLTNFSSKQHTLRRFLKLWFISERVQSAAQYDYNLNVYERVNTCASTHSWMCFTIEQDNNSACAALIRLVNLAVFCNYAFFYTHTHTYMYMYMCAFSVIILAQQQQQKNCAKVSCAAQSSGIGNWQRQRERDRERSGASATSGNGTLWEWDSGMCRSLEKCVIRNWLTETYEYPVPILNKALVTSA